MKKLIKKLFKWVFKDEFSELRVALNKVKRYAEIIDISVDVQEYQHSPSWAVISLKGKKQDFLQFIDLGDADIRTIAYFLKRTELLICY